MLEPVQVAAMKAIEAKTGAPIAVQIRRAIQVYLEGQTVLSKVEVRKLQQQ